MANPTTNFGWVMPTATDLVTDLPADFNVFGQAVDTSLAQLKGGTTGQVLSKTSATDMAFTWVAQDDSNAIQNAIVDAKGDLIGATAADTPARLAVGTNGQVLTADSTAGTGLAWATPSGSMTSIASGSLGANPTSLTSISGSYIDLKLVILNWRPNSANTNLLLQFNTDTGTSYVSELTFTLGTDTSANGTSMRISGGTASTSDTGQIVVDIPNYASTAVWKFISASGYSTPGSGAATTRSAFINGIFNNTAAISSIQILTSSASFNAGTYVLYGVK